MTEWARLQAALFLSVPEDSVLRSADPSICVFLRKALRSRHGRWKAGARTSRPFPIEGDRGESFPPAGPGQRPDIFPLRRGTAFPGLPILPSAFFLRKDPRSRNGRRKAEDRTSRPSPIEGDRGESFPRRGRGGAPISFPFAYFLRARAAPVRLSGQAAMRAGGPAATMRPPLSPPPGPMSTM